MGEIGLRTRPSICSRYFMVELSVTAPTMWMPCTRLSGLYSSTTAPLMRSTTTPIAQLGKTLWCKYSRAVAKNLPPPTHKQTRIPVDLAPYVKPVFEDLSKLQLLEKCIDGATQNQSFNNILWSRCPKTGFCSLVTVEAALGLAILTFNHGFVVLSPLLGKLLGTHPVAFTSKYLESQDSKRVVKAVLKAETTNKGRRQAVRLENRSLEEECIEDEGVTYQAGGF